MEKKNFLVTGGAGFIGSHVVDELLKRADVLQIFIIDKLGMGSCVDNIPDDKRITFIMEDITMIVRMKICPLLISSSTLLLSLMLIVLLLIL